MAVAFDNVIPFLACEAQPLPADHSRHLSAADVARIETLRPLIQEAQLQSRSDLEEACMLIAADRRATLRGYAWALFGTLSEFASQRLVFFAPRCPDFSNSEIWLARTLRAFEGADTAQGRALIAWRVKPNGRRRARFLAGGLAGALAATEVTDAMDHRDLRCRF